MLFPTSISSPTSKKKSSDCEVKSLLTPPDEYENEVYVLRVDATFGANRASVARTMQVVSDHLKTLQRLSQGPHCRALVEKHTNDQAKGFKPSRDYRGGSGLDAVVMNVPAEVDVVVVNQEAGIG